ncbi:MAG: hypothetical protein ACE5LB_12845 [Acidiferrobacterales bacterium]
MQRDILIIALLMAPLAHAELMKRLGRSRTRIHQAVRRFNLPMAGDRYPVDVLGEQRDEP